MSKRKEYTELTTYDIYYVDIKHLMDSKGLSQNILAKTTGLTINTIRAYYHSDIKRIDLDVLSRLCKALNCNVEDIVITKKQ